MSQIPVQHTAQSLEFSSTTPILDTSLSGPSSLTHNSDTMVGTIPTSLEFLGSVPTLSGENTTTTIGGIIPNPMGVLNPSSSGGTNPQTNGTTAGISTSGTIRITMKNTIIGPSNPHPSVSLLFMDNLNIPYLERLINYSIHHDMAWSPMPTKLPYDIPKF